MVVGPSGAGKSTWIKETVDEAWETIYKGKRRPTVVIAHDMHSEFEDHATNTIPTMDWDSMKWNDFLPGSIFILDEIDAICDPSAGKTNTVRRLMNYGRQRGYYIIGASRRPHQAHPDCRAMATRLIVFRPGTPEDADYLTKWLGTETGSKAMQLKEYQHLEIRR